MGAGYDYSYPGFPGGVIPSTATPVPDPQTGAPIPLTALQSQTGQGSAVIPGGTSYPGGVVVPLPPSSSVYAASQPYPTPQQPNIDPMTGAAMPGPQPAPNAPPQASTSNVALQPAGSGVIAPSQMSVEGLPPALPTSQLPGLPSWTSPATAIGQAATIEGQVPAPFSLPQGFSLQPTAYEEAQARGVPIQQVIQERRAAQGTPEQQEASTAIGQPKQTEAGGAAVTTPTPKTAVSEPPSTAPPAPNATPDGKVDLRGARGGNPAGTGTDDGTDRSSYPPVTPRLTQSATRYKQLATDNPDLYQLVNRVAQDVHLPPIDLFNTLYAQSGSTDANGHLQFNMDAQNGLMNISPEQAAELDPTNEFNHDPRSLADNLYLGAQKLRNLYSWFGTNVASAVAAYNYDAAKVNAVSRLPQDQQEKMLPGVMAYIHKATGTDADSPPTALPASQPAPGAPPASGPLPTPGTSAPPAPNTGVTPTPAGAQPASLGPTGAPPPAAGAPGATVATPPAATSGQTPTPPPVAANPNQQPQPGPNAMPGNPGVNQPAMPPATATPTPSTSANTPPVPSPPGTPQHTLTGMGTVTPAGFIQAAQGGPQAAMTYMVNNSPNGMNTGDMWQHMASVLSGAFILRGDMVGAQRAQEYVFQQAHVGSVQSLMQAYTALSAGNNEVAAQLLAKAHAFFPDGTAGGFQVINGQIWGERFDEQTGQPMGQPFHVTLPTIAGALNMSMDPQKWLQTLREEQQIVETNRHNVAEEGLTGEGHQIERERNQQLEKDFQARMAELEYNRQQTIESRNEIARLNAEQRAEAARERFAVGMSRQQQISQARVAEVDRLGQAALNDPNDADVAGWNSAQKGQFSQYFGGAMLGGGVSPAQAVDIAKGLMQTPDPNNPNQMQPSRYMPKRSPDGQWAAVVDRQNTQVVKALIPMNQALKYGIITPQQSGPPQQQQPGGVVPPTALPPPPPPGNPMNVSNPPAMPM